MSGTDTPEVTVIVATRDRAAVLGRALASIERARRAVSAPTSVLVADNGSRDATPALLTEWMNGDASRDSVRVAEAGKACALNAAIARARAPLLAFADDDVEVDARWLSEIASFFAAHPEYDAAVGRIQMPADVPPDLAARARMFGTLPLFDKGDRIVDTHHLYGCNMAVRRRAFERVGLYDERLGVGASGLHEERDLAQRLLAADLRIAYVPGAVVYHEVDPKRLTMETFRAMHVRDARSRFVMGARGWPRAAWHLAGAAATFAVWTALRNPRRQMRARGRVISHLELLRLEWNRGRGAADES